MNLSFSYLLPENFDENSKVWVYQSSRLFSISEALDIEDLLNQFTAEWKSHGSPVKGYANLFFGQFIIIMADETGTGVSGCSTDSSVRLIKQVEALFNVHMFDRQTLAFVINEKVQLLPLSQFRYAVDNKFIQPKTLYFNNLVLTKKQLIEEWLIPVNKSWLKNKLPQIQIQS